jgi:hypothetical protein
MNYAECFPTQNEDTQSLLLEMSSLRESYDNHTLEDRLRYSTLVAQFLHALYDVRSSYRAHVTPPLFGRANIRCDCMWSELLFSAVDTGIMFLSQQTQFEKQPNGPEVVSREHRAAVHQTARRVIGLLYHTIEQIRSKWKGLRPNAFQSIGAGQYDLTQLIALHRWVQAYGLWNRGFLALKSGDDIEPASVFRTCAHILQLNETQKHDKYGSLRHLEKLKEGPYERLTTRPSNPSSSTKKQVSRTNWYTWARTEWLVIAANNAEATNNLPRQLGAVRLLYINERPLPELPLRLWDLEKRADKAPTTSQEKEGVLLNWLYDLYPLLDEDKQMKVGQRPVSEENGFVFTV